MALSELQAAITSRSIIVIVGNVKFQISEMEGQSLLLDITELRSIATASYSFLTRLKEFQKDISSITVMRTNGMTYQITLD